jgi:cytochrome subunit of sulfide dehydrogenase
MNRPRLARRLIGLCAALAALPAPAQDMLLARNLAATCTNCHGTYGRARGEIAPLAGMPADKLLALVADFKSGARPATIMHQIAKGYSDDQLKLIAAYYAAQKP